MPSRELEYTMKESFTKGFLLVIFILVIYHHGELRLVINRVVMIGHTDDE